MEIESLSIDIFGVILFLLALALLYNFFSVVYSLTEGVSSSKDSPGLTFFSLPPGETLILQADSGFTGSLHVTRGSAMSENGEISEGDILDVGVSAEEISRPQEHTIKAGDQGLEGTWCVVFLER